jgi:cytochrome c-type biogenesis protein CcmF
VALLACASTGAAARPLALVMFVLGAFVAAGVVQELARGTRARRVMTGEATPLAVVSLVRRNRRRYGGYLVHLGMTILFVGVAASSAFQHQRDVRLAPGQTANVDGYAMKYVKPTAGFDARANRPERIRLGALLDVSKDGKHVTTLRTERGYYPSMDLSLGPVGRYFEGESTSEVGLRAGLRKDLWTAVAPDQQAIGKVVDAVDKKLANATPQQQLRAAVAFAGVYRESASPAQFRILVSPLVSWVWIGGLLAFTGGLVALWPAPDAVRRRATARQAARVARELGRA